MILVQGSNSDIQGDIQIFRVNKSNNETGKNAKLYFYFHSLSSLPENLIKTKAETPLNSPLYAQE